MKFPGRRKHKHFFPVEKSNLKSFIAPRSQSIHIVGLDQLLVDIEMKVSDEFLSRYKFPKGQSFLIADAISDEIYELAGREDLIIGEYPGGAIGNTLHNFAVLSETPCYALGSIKKQIDLGDYAYKYLSRTSGLVDLTYLEGSTRPMGRAYCFITPDGERTFAISPGCMNDYSMSSLPDEIITQASAYLLSAYTFRNEGSPIFKAGLEGSKLAKEGGVPVVFSLGTSMLVEEKREFLQEYIKEYVTVCAMNLSEAWALVGECSPPEALDRLLDLCDLAMVTVGPQGVYIGCYTDESELRVTEERLKIDHGFEDFNKYEYSRAMKKADCDQPTKVFTSMAPFQGGPDIIKNTNGAGDAALSALLHDICANDYHRKSVPHSPKHKRKFLTYSSISQGAKYVNRASFEVISQNSARLIKPLPEKDVTLDEAFWSE